MASPHFDSFSLLASARLPTEPPPCSAPGLFCNRRSYPHLQVAHKGHLDLSTNRVENLSLAPLTHLWPAIETPLGHRPVHSRSLNRNLTAPKARGTHPTAPAAAFCTSVVTGSSGPPDTLRGTSACLPALPHALGLNGSRGTGRDNRIQKAGRDPLAAPWSFCGVSRWI